MLTRLLTKRAGAKTSYKLANVLLDGVSCLGENQEQENELASVFHKNS